MNKPNEETLAAFASELDAIRMSVLNDVGERDANHIRKVIKIQ